MRMCNYCTLKDIKRRAKQAGNGVTVLADAKWGMGGVNVYVHPVTIKIDENLSEDHPDKAKYRVCWFMELADHCCC